MTRADNTAIPLLNCTQFGKQVHHCHEAMELAGDRMGTCHMRTGKCDMSVSCIRVGNQNFACRYVRDQQIARFYSVANRRMSVLSQSPLGCVSLHATGSSKRSSHPHMTDLASEPAHVPPVLPESILTKRKSCSCDDIAPLTPDKQSEVGSASRGHKAAKVQQAPPLELDDLPNDLLRSILLNLACAADLCAARQVFRYEKEVKTLRAWGLRRSRPDARAAVSQRVVLLSECAARFIGRLALPWSSRPRKGMLTWADYADVDHALFQQRDLLGFVSASREVQSMVNSALYTLMSGHQMYFSRSCFLSRSIPTKFEVTKKGVANGARFV